MELKENSLFAGRYRLIKKLGQGGFGEVWQARDEKLDNMEVAIKVYIAMDDKGIETFRSEYKVAYELNHTNLIHANYFDVSEQRPYLVMPYCERGSAENLIDDIADGGQVSEETLWRFLHDVSSGLAYLHQQEPPLVHQDIKPANILIDNQGHFVITDFGISTRIRSSLRRSSRNVNQAGALPYMGPERFSEDPKPIKASDIWSLGASLYEIAMGELPFCGQGGGMQRAGAEIPKLGKGYSAELNAVMQKCLAKDPWDRPTAEELSGNANDGGGDPNPIRKHITIGAFLTILVAALITLGVVFYNNTRGNHCSMPSGFDGDYGYVDLGLSVKWATCNVGATQPEGFGRYYAWGETEVKSEYTVENSETYGDERIDDISGSWRYDVATAHWGGNWRIPTKAEMEELLNSCKQKWTKRNGIRGCLFTSKINGNSIFLPAAGYRDGSSLYYAGESGYYWSASPDEGNSDGAYYLYFSSGNADWGWYNRIYGRSVRPVSE